MFLELLYVLSSFSMSTTVHKVRAVFLDDGIVLFVCDGFPVCVLQDCVSSHIYEITDECRRLYFVNPNNFFIRKVLNVNDYVVKMPNKWEINL